METQTFCLLACLLACEFIFLLKKSKFIYRLVMNYDKNTPQEKAWLKEQGIDDDDDDYTVYDPIKIRNVQYSRAYGVGDSVITKTHEKVPEEDIVRETTSTGSQTIYQTDKDIMRELRAHVWERLTLPIRAYDDLGSWNIVLDSMENIHILRITPDGEPCSMSPLAIWIHYKSFPYTLKDKHNTNNSSPSPQNRIKDYTTIDIERWVSSWKGRNLEDYLEIQTERGESDKIQDQLLQWTDLHIRNLTVCRISRGFPDHTSCSPENVAFVIRMLDETGPGLVAEFRLSRQFISSTRIHRPEWAHQVKEGGGNHVFILIGHRKNIKTGQVEFMCQNNWENYPSWILSAQDLMECGATISFTRQVLKLKPGIPTINAPMVRVSCDVPESKWGKTCRVPRSTKKEFS
jgi:hypothetical protein